MLVRNLFGFCRQILWARILPCPRLNLRILPCPRLNLRILLCPRLNLRILLLALRQIPNRWNLRRVFLNRASFQSHFRIFLQQISFFNDILYLTDLLPMSRGLWSKTPIHTPISIGIDTPISITLTHIPGSPRPLIPPGLILIPPKITITLLHQKFPPNKPLAPTFPLTG